MEQAMVRDRAAGTEWMEQTETQHGAPPPEPGPSAQGADSPRAHLEMLARQALADSPIFVEHIAGTLSRSIQSLRTGDDTAGLNAFARGISDLEQFVQLFSSMLAVVRPDPTPLAGVFEQELLDCVRGMEIAFYEQDIVTLTDSIEASLLPLLTRWEEVGQELQAGFEM